MEATKALDFPAIEAVTNADGSGEIIVQGTSYPVEGTDEEATRARIVELAAEQAATLGRPVKMTTRGPEGTFSVIVTEDGDVSEDAAAAAPKTQSRRAEAEPAVKEAPAPEATEPEQATKPAIHAVPSLPDEDTPAADPWIREGTTTPRTRREARHSFLVSETVEKPAAKGFRGFLTRAGVRVSPGEAERAERADEQAVSQHWPGQRTIAVVNGKGGAGKTPTTVLLSAVFARYGGAGVLAWDNNQTRGTLGWRTEQGPHEATLLELLPEANRLLSTSAQSADLAHFVHHQTRDRFDVLRSKPMALAHEQRVEPGDVDAIHSVAAKYYRLIFIDSGNDESDPMWLRMIDRADQIVVATTTRNDHAEAGALLLEALADRNEHSARLAREAVAVISQADPKATRNDLANIAKGYETLVRQAVQIPHDPALVDGQISYESLRPVTQRAWLSAASAVADGLSRSRS